MRNTSKPDIQREVEAFMEMACELGRKRPLRDPLALALEELQLTPAQMHTLMWLGTDGALTMGELAARIGITEKTVTGVVDRLERETFLQRERSEEDRRVVHVNLARKGQALYRRLNEIVRNRVGLFLGLLDADDRQALIRILKKVAERLPSRDASDKELRTEE